MSEVEMGEYKFTKHFKNNFSDYLNKIFEENDIPLIAKPEFLLWSPSYQERNFIDIGIIYENEIDNDKPSRVVGIEIEFVSSKEQIIKNYDKFRDYISQRNKGQGYGNTIGGLFHLIFSDANITEKSIRSLLKHSFKEIEKPYFYYAMYLHDIEDRRQYKNLALEFICNDWKFRAQFLALLDTVFDDTFSLKCE